MRQYLLFAFAAVLISMSSCRSDFEFSPSVGELTFSKDTVYLDTVFTNIGSSTYTLKVYNRSNKNISIPTIKLNRGAASGYRLLVDGLQGENGKEFHNVELLAKDSLFIFIETTASVAESNPSDFLYTDTILFGEEGNYQPVELVTLIQDAIFLYPAKDTGGNIENILIGYDQDGNEVRHDGFILESDQLHFTNQKPYVIYGYAAVAANQTLNIDPGARVHFHADSGLLGYNNSTININGTPSLTEDLENEVIFEGDRLEPEFSDLSGQWLAVWMTAGSKGNFRNLTIKNATIGILASGFNENVDYSLNLENIQIYDCAFAGILGQTAHIQGRNVVLNSAGSVSLGCTYGGQYNFTHSTFNNSSPSTQHASLLVNNYIQGADPLVQPLIEATFNNCIIYGSNSTDVALQRYEQSDIFEYQFNSCLLKINTSSSVIQNNPLYNNGNRFINCFFATDSFTFQPRFFDVNKNRLNIGLDSQAIGLADPIFTASAPNDILNVLRPVPADLGAYQAAQAPSN